MKIVALSDVHAQYGNFAADDLPYGDVLIIAGDISNGYHTMFDRLRFEDYIKSLVKKYQKVLCIYGNHDLDFTDEDLKKCGAVPLQGDLPVEIEGISFRGVNMSPCYNATWMADTWRNMTCEPDVEWKAFDIPYCDILVSHCPPHGILDLCEPKDGGEHVGSKALLRYIEIQKPKIVICGHIHEQSGKSFKIGDTLVINTARDFCTIDLTKGLDDYVLVQ